MKCSLTERCSNGQLRRKKENGMDSIFPDRLNPSSYNPRTISPEAAKALAESMREFGDISGFVANTRTGNLVAGHQRLKQLPADYALCRTSESTDAVGTVGYGYIEAHGTRWPVRFVDWPEAKEKAANVAANSPFLAGEFTDGLPNAFGTRSPPPRRKASVAGDCRCSDTIW
jgi:hypothetical protein